MLNKSFFLVRTNPQLTGNVKLVLSSDSKIYLESFNANETLKKDRFKHVRVRDDEFYKETVSQFFDGVENNTIFDVRDINDVSETYTDWKYQFDTIYQSGAAFIEDNYYSETYEYLAPLYYSKNLPSDFIIMRVDGSGSTSQDSNPSNFRNNIIDKWKFVSSFDLTKNSQIGVWLDKNFVSDIGIPKYPLFVRHGDTEPTELSGIDLKHSGWNTITLNLFENFSQNTPIFRSEEFMSELWESNSLLYPHILNLKFLFNDKPATPTSLRNYSLNRYIGFYVDNKDEIGFISPYKGYDLNVDTIFTIEGLDYTETSTIPYLLDNKFIQELSGRIYSFDPIKNGWKEGETYWIEFKQKYYRLERLPNISQNIYDTNQIIGDYIYKVISDTILQKDITDYDYSIPYDLLSVDEKKTVNKVLIIDLGNDYPEGTTYKDRITITDNIINNSNPTLIVFKRVYKQTKINGVDTLQFILIPETSNNVFNIQNYDEADLFLIKILNKNFVIKKIDNNYTLLCDDNVNINTKYIESYINNGNITLDTKYYSKTEIESIPFDGTIPFFNIYRINFTEIKDFDFNRVNTDSTLYEYEKKYEIKHNLEPKFFMKELRNSPIDIKTLKIDYGRRVAITDENNRTYLSRYLRGQKNILTNSDYTPDDLYYKNIDGSWQLTRTAINGTNWYDYDKNNYDLKRDYYREENYIWNLTDNNNNVLGNIDFNPDSDPASISENLSFGANGYNQVSDKKSELPNIKSVDPNQEIDKNCVPISSEYINSNELFELRNNNLSPIWNKNQNVCKFGYKGSIGTHDYQYRLNNSLDMGIYNNQPIMSSNKNYPVREQMNLDYFYRFNLVNKENYDFYSIHLDEISFNVDNMFRTDYDYFSYLFDSTYPTSNGLKMNKKYSSFNVKDNYSNPETLFRGCKYNLLDVSEIIYDPEELASTGKKIIDDITTNVNTNYEDYKFSIIFSTKKSTFVNNNGLGNSNMGIDIYLNDYWKTCLIHLYINTDDTLLLSTNNAETCEIDLWYNDVNDSRDINPTLWDEYEFKINSFGIGLRPRDFMLLEVYNIIQNKNYSPSNVENKSKINFIHIYGDGKHKIMNYTNTDFIIDMVLPTEILVNEFSFITSAVDSKNIPVFPINNTLDNRIIKTDNLNNLGLNYNSDGLLIGSVNDINCYNNYPIATNITKNLLTEQYSWELDQDKSPSIFRFDGPYLPILKEVSLFRPYSYNLLKNNNLLPVLPNGNYKFYDTASDSTKPLLTNFGMLDEIIYSKVNKTSSILKIQDPTNKDKSIYPMVDEYGYDFNQRYIFSANFEPSFYTESKIIDVPSNEKVNLAGYTIHYDGVKEFLRIPDQTKFNQENYLIPECNFNNYILNPITGERSVYDFNITLDTKNNTKLSKSINLLKGITYKITFTNVSSDFPLENRNMFIKPSYIKYGLSDLTTFATPHYYTALNIGDSSIPQAPIYINTTHYNSIPSITTFTGSLIPQNYYNDNLINVLFDITLASNTPTLNNLLTTINIKIEMINHNQNVVQIDTDNWYLNNNKNNELGDILFGSFIKKYSENDLIENYPAFSKKSLASVMSYNINNNNSIVSNLPLDSVNYFDKNSYNPNNQNYKYVWLEFAGLVSNKRPGRIGKPAYDIINNPIPKNWDGLIYIDILNRLNPNSGENLKKYIILNGGYGYNTYSGFTSVSLGYNNFNKDAFNRSTLYNFLEYESQTNATAILNEFYKISGFNNLSNRGFSSYFPYQYNTINLDGSTISSVSPFSISNNNTFTFEPDETTHLLDGKKIIYIGKKEGNLVLPSYTFIWYKSKRDKNFSINIIPSNGNIFNATVNLINVNNYNYVNDNEFIILLNNIFNEYSYNVSFVSTNTQSSTFRIDAPSIGSYYNFTTNILTSTDFKEVNFVKSDSSTVVSEKYTKTSLKDNRNNNRINSITIEFWVKIEGWGRDYETIIYKGLDDNRDAWLDTSFFDFTYIIGKYSDTNKLCFKTCHEQFPSGNFKTHTLISNFNINDGKYHHIAFSVDFSTLNKSIYIDGVLDSYVYNYLDVLDTEGNTIDNTPDEREMVAQFIEHRERFISGLQHPSLGIDIVLANLIRLNATDQNTLYWYDVIRGLIPATPKDLQWMYDNWATTIDVAYQTFKDNYKNLNYYLKCDSSNLDYDILISTDSAVKNGNRNFCGLIDELRIWNYSRTSDQIMNNYRYILNPKSYHDPLNSLVAYFRFDEGQGVNIIHDLTNNSAPHNMSKWSHYKTTYINDGRNEQEYDEISYFQFIESVYSGSSIAIDDSLVDWDISGATILGISDERSQPIAPKPVLTKTIREIKPTIIPDTKYNLMKRRMNRLNFNIKTKILNVTIQRTFQFRPIKWWLFKTIESRVVESTYSSTLRFNVIRQGNWTNQVLKLINKNRNS